MKNEDFINGWLLKKEEAMHDVSMNFIAIKMRVLNFF